MSAHLPRQFISLDQPVGISVHTGEHCDQSGAEFIGADHAVAIAVNPVKAEPVMRQNLVPAQCAVAVAVDGGGVENAVLLVMGSVAAGDGEAGDNHARQCQAASDHHGFAQCFHFDHSLRSKGGAKVETCRDTGTLTCGGWSGPVHRCRGSFWSRKRAQR